MSKISPEDIAGGAKALADSAWGEWYLSELKRKRDLHIASGQKTDAHNVTVNSVMRSAGIQEAIDLISLNAGVADSTLFKTK